MSKNLQVNAKITIVVCCKDNINDLLKTANSINYIKTKPYEVIFCLNNLNLPTNVLLNFNYRVLNDPGDGVYQAMNYSLTHVITPLVLFLNASDEIIGDPLNGVNSEGVLPYGVIGALANRKIKPNYYYTIFGTSYCHQGVIYNVNGLSYDERFSISADYLSILQNFPSIKKAKRYNKGHVIFYKGGLSTIRYKDRDREILQIMRERDYFFNAILFFAVSKFKILIKILL